MLTPKQARVLRGIVEHLDRTGTVPTMRQLMAACEIRSIGTVHNLVGKLVERGFLRRIPHRAHGIEVLRRPGQGALTGETAQLLGEARMYVADHADTAHGAGLLARIDAALTGANDAPPAASPATDKEAA